MFKLVGIHFITTLLPCSNLSVSRFPARWSYNRPFAEMMGFIWISIHLGTHYVPSLADYYTINCQEKKYCTGRLLFPKVPCRWLPKVHFDGTLQLLFQVTKGTHEGTISVTNVYTLKGIDLFFLGELWEVSVNLCSCAGTHGKAVQGPLPLHKSKFETLPILDGSWGNISPKLHKFYQ